MDGQTTEQRILSELHRIGAVVERHGEILEKMSSVLIEQAKVSEQVVAMGERQNRHEEATNRRLDRLEIRAEENRTAIVRWSGGVSVLAALAGAGAAYAANVIPP